MLELAFPIPYIYIYISIIFFNRMKWEFLRMTILALSSVWRNRFSWNFVSESCNVLVASEDSAFFDEFDRVENCSIYFFSSELFIVFVLGSKKLRSIPFWHWVLEHFQSFMRNLNEVFILFSSMSSFNVDITKGKNQSTLSAVMVFIAPRSTWNTGKGCPPRQ